MSEPASNASVYSPKDFITVDLDVLQGSLVSRFEQTVHTYPDRLAVRCDGEIISYAALNKAANLLAHNIFSTHGAKNEPIALILDHSPPAIQAIWGILKSGNAYVPISPYLPLARISQILEDTGTRLVVTNNIYLPTSIASLPTGGSFDIINLDQMESGLPTYNLNLSIPSQNIAYIIYTSGTTGAPKGVILTHQSTLSCTIAQINDLRIAPSDRIALFTSLSYEASRFSLYGALLSGSALCLYDIRSKGVSDLAGWVVQERITVLISTSSTFRHMLSSLPTHKGFENLRVVNLGGEPTSTYEVTLFRQHFPRSCIFINTLGTSEVQTATRYYVDHQTWLVGNSLPVGYPIQDKLVEIVDDSGQSLGADEIGEILIKGRYLSPGYWRKPELTAEKFTPDPDDPDLMMFHTGDLGRLRQDGCLEHLGRKDSQIKIRGFRIEIAEIESVLHQFPGIHNVAVVARDSHQSTSDKQLVAYIEPEKDIVLSKIQLHNSLAQKLPDYMVPAIFVILESFPLSSTGKINVPALPTPEEAGQAQEQVYIPAQDPVETKLVQIWERLLKFQPIGIQYNFFELGGNSLLAAQLFDQIEKAFRKKLPLATLFQAGTIEQQAAILRQENWVPNWSSLVTLQSGGLKVPLFLAAPVGGNVLSYRDLVINLPADQPCYGLQALGLDGAQAPHSSINEVAAHYIHEIQTVQPKGPYYLAGSSFGGLVAYEMAQQLQDMGQPVALVIMFDAYGPNYPRRKPGNTRLRRQAYKYLRRIDTHMSNLVYNDWHGRVVYIQSKGQKLFLRISRSLRNRLDQILYPMPRELKKVREAHFGAAKKRARYAREQRRFDGRLVLFRASKQPLGIYPDPTLGWSAAVGENIEVYEVPGHHTSIIYEPRAHILAARVNEILKQVQTCENNLNLSEIEREEK